MASTVTADAMQKAYVAIERGAYAEARRIYTDILKDDPTHRSALHGLGRAEALLQRYMAAVAAFDRLIAVDPKSAPVHNDRGRALFALRRIPEAEEAFGRVVELDPQSWDGWHNRGLMLMEMGRFDAAAECFDYVVRLKPTYPAVYVNRATVRQRMKRFNEALADLEIAVELDPESSAIHKARGVLLSEMGRTGDAVAAFEQALHLTPGDADAEQRLAALLLPSASPPEPALPDGPRAVPSVNAEAPSTSAMPPGPAPGTAEVPQSGGRQPPQRAREHPAGAALIPVSVGELVDRLTQIDLELERTAEGAERERLAHDYRVLADLAARYAPRDGTAEDLRLTLRAVNEALLDIRGHLRIYEEKKTFDEVYVDLARNITILDDQRQLLRDEVNRLVETAYGAPSGTAQP